MKKIIVLSILAVMIFCLCSCSGGGITIEDADKAAFALVTSLEFDDDMAETENDATTLKKYGLDENSGVVNVSRYVGSGATADEVAVFECSSAEGVAKVKEAIDSRIKYLHDGYASYGPEEVPKIDSANVLEYGNFVVFCISKTPEKTADILSGLK
jgi:hypothetical protein